MKEESIPVTIARVTVESFVRTGNMPDISDLPRAEERRAGCFVSLHSGGALRGCIGTIAPTAESLGAEIVRNAVCACSEDPRFDAVTPEELDSLEYSVDVLEPSEPVSSPDELDPKKYGVIVTSGFRRGLLLPDLEGVETVEAQLAIACRKAGIPPEGPFDIRRFQVTRYH